MIALPLTGVDDFASGLGLVAHRYGTALSNHYGGQLATFCESQALHKSPVSTAASLPGGLLSNLFVTGVCLPLFLSMRGTRVTVWPAANRRVPFLPIGNHIGIVHDISLRHAPRRYGRLRDSYLKRVVLPSLRRMSALVAVSEATKGELVHFGVEPAKIRVIPNAVDHDVFFPERIAQAQHLIEHLLGAGVRYGLCVNRIESPVKNHIALLHAWRLLRSEGHDEKLVLVGAPWPGSDETVAAIRKAEAEGWLLWLQGIDLATLRALYSFAQVHVCPSKFEGFGLTALESMACGTPTIVSRGTALEEVAGNAAITFDASSVSALASAIRGVLSSPEGSSKLREAGLARATEFQWETSERALIELIDEVVDHG